MLQMQVTILGGNMLLLQSRSAYTSLDERPLGTEERGLVDSDLVAPGEKCAQVRVEARIRT
jgi:hypothetical protein